MKRNIEIKKELLKQVKTLHEKIEQLEKKKDSHAQTQESLRESMELYQTLIEISPDAIVLCDLQYRIIMVNQQAVKMHGFDLMDEMIGRDILSLIAPKDRQKAKKPLGPDNTRNVEYSFLKKDGTVFSGNINISLIRDSKGNPQVYIGTIQDMTAYNKIVDKLKHKSKFEKLVASLSTKFINLDTEKIDTGINDALRIIGEFAKADRSYIFLFSLDEKIMDNTHEWCAIGIKPQIQRLKKLPVKMFPWFIERIKRAETVYVPYVAELPESASAEKKEWELENIKSLINLPLVYKEKVIGFVGFDAVEGEKEWDEDMQILLRIAGDMFACVIKRREMDRDIKLLNRELLKTNIRLKQLTLRDSLTGLYNYRYFEEAIEAEFIRAKRYALPLSVIMLDVDYFKSINDVYGHEFGDLVLKQFSKQLVSMVRKYDTVIRYGGEEFVIITPGAGKDIALILAQRLMDVIKLYNFGDKRHKVKLKLSVALASFPEDKIHKGSDFIKINDYILNRVKEMGGDRVYSYLDLKKSRHSITEKEGDSTDIKALKEKLGKLTKRANQSLAEAIFAFAKTIEIKDHYTGEHVEKTVHYSTEIAKEKGLSKEEVELVRQAAILHDLGKIGISEKILYKKSKLTKKEYEEIKKHPQIGVDILRPIHFFHAIIPYVLHHHERWDGKGYPYGLKEEEIPLGARIIALADAYEALTSNRRYRKACFPEAALKKIKQVAGTQFDPEIVDIFLSIIEKEKKKKY